jgi:hypothetical protein
MPPVDPQLGYDPGASALDDTPEQFAARTRATVKQGEQAYLRTLRHPTADRAPIPSRTYSAEETAATQRRAVEEAARKNDIMANVPPDLRGMSAVDMSPLQYAKLRSSMGLPTPSAMETDLAQAEWLRERGYGRA